jgi:GTP-binding protein
MNSELARDAGKPAEFPVDGLPEVAILGRSNVGKSSVINTLVGRKKLARTSSTPGKTRRIHFFAVEGAMHLVDLPGFGWARVGREERASWRPMVEAYLRGTRESLRGAILLVDLRRGPGDEERSLLAWLAAETIDVRVIWTKADKLKPQKGQRQAREFARELELEEGSWTAVSTLKGTGFAPVVDWLRDWTSVEFKRADGTAF